MRLCRFSRQNDPIVRVGLAEGDDRVLDLRAVGVESLGALLEIADPVAAVQGMRPAAAAAIPLTDVRLHAPVERHEVWAAGVTYLRSKTARMEESDFSASAYDKVYAADRPEIFFKALGEKVAGPGDEVGIRGDASWNVPEPELALVLNSRGVIIGQTIGNDMSSRDIEGANLLYLPQAKVYRSSCALGPWILLGATEQAARDWTIRIAIYRSGERVFAGETSVGNIKRSFEELAAYLFRCQTFPHGAVLLTGTGIVPPDVFTLQAQDVVEIEIAAIGSLRNTVMVV
jgi:2-dehydro-3-deoxy-D-arabinonate dehydratase